MRTPTVRITTMMVAAALAAAGCSAGGGATRRVSSKGTTAAIEVDGDEHVAFLVLDKKDVMFGAAGELHVAAADGKDTKIADGIFAGGYVLSPRGKGMLYEQMNGAGDDAALFWVDLSRPSAGKLLFGRGLQTQPVTPGTKTPTYTVPLRSIGFLTPSGRYFIMGVLPPDVANSGDLHVIDMDTGEDVFSRPNGAFDYLELALPDDTMIFQDAEGNNSGPSAPPGVQKLYWVALGGGAQATEIAERTGGLTPSGDNKTLVYQNADTRELYAWDVVGKPATGTKIASNALGFAVADSGPVAYIGTDHSLHVVDFTGKETLAVDGATAQADFLSPVYISGDGADVYWFQKVATQKAQGTLMHVAATAGATPNEIADSASIEDVHPVAGALLYLANVDGTGSRGDAFQAARDGSGAMPLGTGVAVGFFAVATSPAGGATWASAHLTGTGEDTSQRLIDAARPILGGLELTQPSGNSVIDPAVRSGQFALSDDLSTLAWIGGVAYDAGVANFVGKLQSIATGAPAVTPASPILSGVTELGVVSSAKKIFVNAPKAPTPGVYLVDLAALK